MAGVKGGSMQIRRVLSVATTVLGCALVLLVAPAARAANNAVFRDCALLIAPIDADFLHLSGVTVETDGSLTVPAGQNSVELTASESFDPGDNSAHVTVTATITSPGMDPQTVSASGTDFAILPIPLTQHSVGRVYTISWTAAFDNGQHMCPSAITLQNTPSNPNPFVVTVTAP
jgi:hypothetical protein